MTRQEAINFGNLWFELNENAKESETYQFFKIALASLKTDEAYQLEYENRDFVEISKGMTNGEVIQAVFPNISVYEHGSTYSVNNEYNFNSTWWNAPYQKGGE